MFTNYDGAGNGFGNTLVKSEYDNEDISVYSSIEDDNENIVKIIVTNRSVHEETPVRITLSSDNKYSDAEVYSLYGDSSEIHGLDGIDKISDNSFEYCLKPLSVTEFIVHKKEKNIAVPIIAAISAAAAAIIGICIALKRKNK